MNIQIKILGSDDIALADDLAHIMISAWRAGFRNILLDAIIEKYTGFQPCADMFRKILASGTGTMYLAQANGQAAGLLYWLDDGEIARIEALLTVPEVWGKGIASALIEQALADTVNFRCITVWPFSKNHRARRFYEKHSFTPTGRCRMGDAAEVEYLRTRITT